MMYGIFSPDDCNLSFLYSVKIDPAVLALDPRVGKELDKHMTALEVADSVLDVRHAFFQARIFSMCSVVLGMLCSWST